MVASGHHHDPQMPEIPGTFSGSYFHSHSFKKVDQSYQGKRVLVIGAGNSACDIAVETARVAAKTCIAVRSASGSSPNSCSACQPMCSRLVLVVRRVGCIAPFQRCCCVCSRGRNRAYGLPEPKTPLFSQHPTLNSELFYFIRHGEIEPRPGVARFDGNMVEFRDGRREEFDIVVAATGYWTTFPFFDQALINYKHATRIPLYKKMMHADFSTLYFIGLFQPLGCIWPLADYQAQIAVRELRGHYQRPANLRQAIQHELANPAPPVPAKCAPRG